MQLVCTFIFWRKFHKFGFYCVLESIRIKVWDQEYDCPDGNGNPKDEAHIIHYPALLLTIVIQSVRLTACVTRLGWEGGVAVEMGFLQSQENVKKRSAYPKSGARIVGTLLGWEPPSAIYKRS